MHVEQRNVLEKKTKKANEHVVYCYCTYNSSYIIINRTWKHAGSMLAREEDRSIDHVNQRDQERMREATAEEPDET